MVVDRLASVDDGSCVPKVYGCTDPLAVNFDQAANSYDNTGVLGERCRAARCVRGSSPHAIATAALPVCPTGWTGPRGGLCVRHVGNLAETQPWHCADGGSVVEFGDGATICEEDTRCDAFYWVLRGEVLTMNAADVARVNGDERLPKRRARAWAGSCQCTAS